ncbi:MAG TPA: hypothetical protein VEI54_04605 [Candidatus Limnocylindrales bacterium]|nr:hypothetical protein [Candidatus Limnocylindrales bacterium]
MSAQARCHCQSCTIRGLMWPAAVIAVGILVLLHQLYGGRLHIGYTYPVLLVVMGLLLLASSVVSREGHVELTTQAGPQAPLPPTSGNAPQAPYSSQGQ